MRLREGVKGCVLTRLRDLVDAVEKGSGSAAARKHTAGERERERERVEERKGAEKRERDEKEGTA